MLGFQSIAQVSSTYGHGEAQTIVENCSNTLILRCSASENGGTARFASKLIGEREVIRPTISRTRKGGFFAEPGHSVSRGEQHVIESAVLPAEVEQLPDLSRLPEIRESSDMVASESPTDVNTAYICKSSRKTSRRLTASSEDASARRGPVSDRPLDTPILLTRIASPAEPATASPPRST